jgi:hypothetical protein
MKNIEIPFEKAVISETHDSMYMMHKYWARKPANVVSEYINYFTEESDVVFDPFGGSGVTAIEAAKLNRKAIYNDLSQTALFIAKETGRKVDIDSLTKEFNSIIQNTMQETEHLYETKCTVCGHPKAFITHTFWKKEKYDDKDRISLIKTKCSACKNKCERDPIEEDFVLNRLINETEISNWIPEDTMLTNGRLLVKEGMKVTELFTKRALIVLSTIFNKISKISDDELRSTMEFCFTSSLAQSSKLVPYYSKPDRKNEVGGWSIPGFWIPERYCEVNAINCFNEIFKKIKLGKAIISSNFFENIKWENESATYYC